MLEFDMLAAPRVIDMFNLTYKIGDIWYTIVHPVTQAAKKFCEKCPFGEWNGEVLLISGEENQGGFFESIPDDELYVMTM